MRPLISLASLLLVVVVVGWLAKSQLRPHTAARTLATPSDPAPAHPGAGASPQQIQQQYQRALDDALQPRRAEEVP